MTFPPFYLWTKSGWPTVYGYYTIDSDNWVQQTVYWQSNWTFPLVWTGCACWQVIDCIGIVFAIIHDISPPSISHLYIFFNEGLTKVKAKQCGWPSWMTWITHYTSDKKKEIDCVAIVFAVVLSRTWPFPSLYLAYRPLNKRMVASRVVDINTFEQLKVKQLGLANSLLKRTLQSFFFVFYFLFIAHSWCTSRAYIFSYAHGNNSCVMLQFCAHAPISISVCIYGLMRIW